MRKALKIIVGILLSPVVLFPLLTILFYIPMIQNWAVRQVALYASEMTGMEISVGHVNLAFPLDLAVEEVRVLQPSSNPGAKENARDTIADIKSGIVRIQFLPLLQATVKVDELQLQNTTFNTADFIAQAGVSGRARKISLHSDGIDLKQEHVSINDVLLSGADICVQLNDTIVPEDTTSVPSPWKISLQHLQIENTSVALRMPDDSLSFGMNLGKAVVNDGFFDLAKPEYRVGSAEITNSKLRYNNELELDLKRLATTLSMDSTTLRMPSLALETIYSYLQMSMTMDLSAFDEQAPEKLELDAKAALGKPDIALFLPKELQAAWPHYPLTLDAALNGNINHLDIERFLLELPTAFSAKAGGYVANFTDVEKLLANINFNATTYSLDFLTNAYLDRETRKTVRLPSGIKADGNIRANGNLYSADLKAQQGGGRLNLKGNCNIDRMSYDAVLSANAFPLQSFLPTMGLSPLSARVNIKGVGTDVFSKRTLLNAEAEIGAFHFSDFDLSGTTAEAKIEKGELNARLNCVNELLRGNISLDALMNLKDIRATLACSLDKADFYGMRLTETPLSTSLCAHIDMESDLDDFYKVEGFVSDILIQDSAEVFRTDEISLNLVTRTDSTWAKVYSGDISLDFNASGGYKSLLSLTDNLTQEMTRQIERKFISQDSLKQVLPIGRLRLHTGNDNFIATYAQSMGFMFRTINADITSSPTEGLNGWAQADSLIVSGTQLDKVRIELLTEDNVFKYNAQVQNFKDNPDICFNALLDGSLFETGSDMKLRLYDPDDKLGISLGVKAMFEENGIRIRLSDKNTLLGYRNFTANDDNFIFLADDKRISAYMLLRADDGTGLQIYSDEDETEEDYAVEGDEDEENRIPRVLQDLTLGINHLDLASIVSLLPYCPKIEGILDGDFHIIQTEKELSLSSSLGIDGLKYENCEMGDISTEFVYIPKEEGGHYVDGILSCNGDDVATIKGTYLPLETIDSLSAEMELTHLPLSMVNAFIPDQLMGLRGFGDGMITINGSLSNLDVNGSVDLDEAYIFSVPYGVELRFDDHPVKIEHSVLLLQNFNMFSHNNQQMVINGRVDFSNLDNMTMDVRLAARNFLIIDSKEQRKSEVFGKTFVNCDASISGRIDDIRMRGNLDVLGTTNMTYILRDSPLSNDSRLDELVTFVDFSDDKEEPVQVRPAQGGLYMDMNINIDQGAHIVCALNAEKSNYLDIIGGGNLRFVYSDDDMRMTGRYTLKSGELKYSLPVIPLKTFDIQDGSYVEFTGDVMNPTLNITALETTKATVSTSGRDRTVAFNCGVKITQTLNNMGLEFLVEAPEDMTENNRLQAMSVEERGKLAVTMLTTGMYLTEENMSALSMNSALNSFLQSEINSITGNALRTLDLSIGIDNSTDAAGAMHTDYSFKFAKRFWNNRFRVVVGGKVSDNADTEDLFDNISLEYRLDQSANTNLEMFYKRSVYDYLEGYLENYGVGIVWKKKTQSLSDLLRSVKKSIVSTIENHTKTEKKEENNEKPDEQNSN